jgi:hypothetical protein
MEMLKPTADRLDYSKMLAPPSGYETVFAVGTTYSLDLDALIGISIALGLSESIDSGLKENPIYLLEALQKTANKVLVFCEGGQIKAPTNAHALHILLEQMVFEIVLKNKKSFHPKFWLVKYENVQGEALFRCVVLSRNLTFDRSWDVAVCIEGRVKADGRLKNGYDQSRPISDFLQSLLKLAKRNEINLEKRKSLLRLADEILDVKFQLDDKQFSDFTFCPIGIDGYDSHSTELFNSYHELFVISPFLSDSTIYDFNKQALSNPNKNTLITRRSELSKLKSASVTHFDMYVMKDLIVSGEDAISDGDMDEVSATTQNQDIHAKVYLKTKYSDSELFLGSLNASHSACYGNIEFLLKLYGKRRNLNVEQLKKDIFGDNDKDNPFEKAEISTEDQLEKPVSDNLEKVIKDICRLKSSAKVVEYDETYSLEITFEKLPVLDHVSISPLLSNKVQALSDKVVFTDLRMLQLSEFYVIEAVSGDESVSRVIKIKTDNIPNTRESALVNDIVKDKHGFVQYITFLLGDDYLLSMIENNSLANNGFIIGSGAQIPALYEKMLKAAVHSPQRFDEIKRLMELISDSNIIPEGFRELYEVFEKVVIK